VITRDKFARSPSRRRLARKRATEQSRLALMNVRQEEYFSSVLARSPEIDLLLLPLLQLTSSLWLAAWLIAQFPCIGFYPIPRRVVDSVSIQWTRSRLLISLISSPVYPRRFTYSSPSRIIRT
jgi:hypothetical protein